MDDYLKIFEKFKDVKEIEDFITDVNYLRYYYRIGQYQQMRQHIHSLTQKYVVEAFIWNTVNRVQPITNEQSYINAENFLQIQGAKILVKNIDNYKQHLTKEEIDFIELMNSL